MNNAGVDSSEIKKILMQDEEFKREYETMKPQYEEISQNLTNKSNNKY